MYVMHISVIAAPKMTQKVQEVAAERDAAMLQLVVERDDVLAMRAPALYIHALNKQRLQKIQMQAVASRAMHERDAAQTDAACFQQGAESAFEYAANAARTTSEEGCVDSEVFSLKNVKQSIEAAVTDIITLSHPDITAVMSGWVLRGLEGGHVFFCDGTHEVPCIICDGTNEVPCIICGGCVALAS
jgi:hypothetical protein